MAASSGTVTTLSGGSQPQSKVLGNLCFWEQFVYQNIKEFLYLALGFVNIQWQILRTVIGCFRVELLGPVFAGSLP